MTFLRRTLLILLLCSISGCSQKFQDVQSTMHEAVFGFDDIKMSHRQVAQLDYASIYARINHGPQIFMVLALVDRNPVTGNDQLKWMSADGAMITTENGRIIKTTSLPNANLLHISSDNNLVAPSHKVSSWDANYDWQPGYHFSELARVKSFPIATQTTASLLWTKPTTKVREIITFSESQQQMQSEYWLDKNGQVVKSAQALVPNALFIELEVLKPYLR